MELLLGPRLGEAGRHLHHKVHHVQEQNAHLHHAHDVAPNGAVHHDRPQPGARVAAACDGHEEPVAEHQRAEDRRHIHPHVGGEEVLLALGDPVGDEVEDEVHHGGRVHGLHRVVARLGHVESLYLRHEDSDEGEPEGPHEVQPGGQDPRGNDGEYALRVRDGDLAVADDGAGVGVDNFRVELHQGLELLPLEDGHLHDGGAARAHGERGAALAVVLARGRARRAAAVLGAHQQVLG
mmetsp:Transcript_19645/g.66848  ORF Transcript_19645/g.66848 Transcript_19645/m.66848 type:complete len:237 (+) Transcript_19645:3990-4700(+)